MNVDAVMHLEVATVWSHRKEMAPCFDYGRIKRTGFCIPRWRSIHSNVNSGFRGLPHEIKKYTDVTLLDMISNSNSDNTKSHFRRLVMLRMFFFHHFTVVPLVITVYGEIFFGPVCIT